MYSLQIEQLARQRTGELRRTAAGRRARVAHRLPGADIRNRTGWTLIAIGLRLAESGHR
jgi:hypothetical protein